VFDLLSEAFYRIWNVWQGRSHSLGFDNHESQLSIAAIIVPNENDISLLTLPPIHYISYVNWTATSVVRTEHREPFDLIIGYSKSRQTATIWSVTVFIWKSFGKAFVILNTGIYCSAWWALRDIWMSPLHWILTFPTWHVSEGLLRFKCTWFNKARWWKVVSSWSKVR